MGVSRVVSIFTVATCISKCFNYICFEFKVMTEEKYSNVTNEIDDYQMRLRNIKYIIQSATDTCTNHLTIFFKDCVRRHNNKVYDHYANKLFFALSIT